MSSTATRPCSVSARGSVRGVRKANWTPALTGFRSSVGEDSRPMPPVDRRPRGGPSPQTPTSGGAPGRHLGDPAHANSGQARAVLTYWSGQMLALLPLLLALARAPRGCRCGDGHPVPHRGPPARRPRLRRRGGPARGDRSVPHRAGRDGAGARRVLDRRARHRGPVRPDRRPRQAGLPRHGRGLLRQGRRGRAPVPRARPPPRGPVPRDPPKRRPRRHRRPHA